MSYAGQARKEVARAYRPAFKALNRQERRVQSVNKKQQNDERAYASWLKSTQNQIASAAAARDAQLQGVEAQQSQQAQALMSQAQEQAAQRGAGAGVGSTGLPWSNPAPGHDPTTEAIAGSARAVTGVSAAAFPSRDRLAGGMLASTQTNNFAYLAKLRADRRLAVLDAISKIADQRGDLHAKAAAETAKRTAELQQSAADAALAQQKLDYAASQDAIQNDLAQQRVNATLSGQDLTARGQNMTARQRRADRRQRARLQKERLAASGGAGGSKAPSQSQVARARQEVSYADTRLSALIAKYGNDLKKHGYTEPKNWQALVRYLVSRGEGKISVEAATIAVAHHHGHGTKDVPTAWDTLIRSQASSR